MLFTSSTQRPRNIDAPRAAALLYGDLGTSKAYVIGLAFAIAGYSSFWIITAVSLLTLLVGLNYITICKYYPNGGGVYTSVRNRSTTLSLIGAFFIIADYIVTASLSALSAFSYFKLGDPVLLTVIAILAIGALNYFGPQFIGRQAFFIVVFALICLMVLFVACIPFLKSAWENVKPVTGGFVTNWNHFVSVIVALSGVEAIANITGIMKLDPGSTDDNPSVTSTAKKAILAVILEVVFFTSFFSFASMALSGLQIQDGQVWAPHHEDVRDFMLRYMGESFVGQLLSPHLGIIFGWIISIAIGILLLSAVNTAINGLIAILFLMARDDELHPLFARLNRFGVPLFPLVLATLAPILIVNLFDNIAELANLYAIGFVGAIATNFGATSTDKKIPLKIFERIPMFIAFLIMIVVELTLFIDKPAARSFVLLISLIGLILRNLTKELRERKKLKASPHLPHFNLPPPSKEDDAILCQTNHADRTLNYALQNAKELDCPLYLLYIREQAVVTPEDISLSWEDDPIASDFFKTVKQQAPHQRIYFCYAVSDYPANTIAGIATKLNTNLLVLGVSHHNKLFHFLRGNLIRDIHQLIPERIRLIIITEESHHD